MLDWCLAHQFLEDAFGNCQFVQAGQALTKYSECWCLEVGRAACLWSSGSEKAEGATSVMSVESSRGGVGAVIAYNSLLVL